MKAIQYSLEIFPPATAKRAFSLWQAINQYQKLSPRFISVTSSAGGSGEGFTQEVADAILAQGQPVAIHLTCRGRTKDELKEKVQAYWDKGIRRFLVLRGDPPKEGSVGTGDFPYASDGVRQLREWFGDEPEILVAGYPDVHPEAYDLKSDLENLKHKIDCGANGVITQFFFDPDVYLNFREAAAKENITVPIIPGILPILNFENMKKFAEKCGTKVPDFLDKMFDAPDFDRTDQQLLAMNVLSHQITRLIQEDVDTFHFYTLNETLLTRHIAYWLHVGF